MGACVAVMVGENVQEKDKGHEAIMRGETRLRSMYIERRRASPRMMASWPLSFSCTFSPTMTATHAPMICADVCSQQKWLKWYRYEQPPSIRHRCRERR